MAVKGEPVIYTDQAEIGFLGRRFRCLDLSREISPDIPVYPGHAKVAFWTHLTYEEAAFRTNGGFAYTVKGMALCAHVSTHLDTISHLNPERIDLSIDTLPLEKCFTEGLGSTSPRRRRARTSRWTRSGEQWGGPALNGFRGWLAALPHRGDGELARPPRLQHAVRGAGRGGFALDTRPFVNVLTDAVSTDNPADLIYPNHHAHAEYLGSATPRW